MTGGLIVTYFPYTLLEESELKRLYLYVARLRLLRIDPKVDPGLSPALRATGFIQLVSPVEESTTLERVRFALGNYRHLGALRPEGGLLQSFSAFAFQDDPEKSTARLRAHLRGRRPKSAPEEAEFVNAAVFLLLAHEVDREHLELESHLDGVRVLETEFAEVLGLSDEQGKELEVGEEPGVDDLERWRSGQAAQRLRAWTRLHVEGGAKMAIPLTTSVAVMEEIWERLPSHLAAISIPPPPEPRILCRLPDPRILSMAEVLALREKLERAGSLRHWWQTVAAALQALEDSGPEAAKEVEVAAGAFLEHWPTGQWPDLELRVTSYPRLPAITAFALATGLKAPAPDLVDPQGKNGVSLLLAPELGGGRLQR